MTNTKHSLTTPRDFRLVVSAVETAWQEGYGLDMDNYTDLTYNQRGSNWARASSEATWTTAGGDWDNDDSSSLTASFTNGTEDLELNITPIVEKWIAGTKDNNGVIIRLTADLEDAETSYYTKKFYGRTSEFFFRRPVIEARWDSATKDDRANFYYSSSNAPAADNLNTLYFYNYIRGRLTNIPNVGTGSILLSLYSGSSGNPGGSKLALSKGGGVVTAADVNVTGGYVSTGIYSASVAITASSTNRLTTLYDIWHSGSVQYHTGTLEPQSLYASNYNPNPTYVTTVNNLKPVYRKSETNRLRLYTRTKDWSPTIYNKASKTIERTIIDSGSYRITRNIDRTEVIPFGTGSDLHTQMSFDVSGNYFDLDFSMLEPGYSYTLDFSYYNGSIDSWTIQPEKFKFRVE